MVGNLPRDPSLNNFARNSANINDPEDLDCYARRWYFRRQDVEELSPSRKDGIREEEESYLRKLYSLFIKDLGKELKVPQLSIATAILMCHRFYMRQSHAKNCWKTIATACLFLGCKVEETSRRMSDVIVAAYKLMHKWDPSAPKRIKEKGVYDKQKELILDGESILLATLAFNLNFEHPYKPLVVAVKKLEISDKELVKLSWNYVNDCLPTTLCLEYKPHYIAAGSIFLAAELLKVKLPKGWRMQFEISPEYFGEVVQRMCEVLTQNQQHAQQSFHSKGTAPKTSDNSEGTAPKTSDKKALSCSPESCTLNCAVVSSSRVLKTTENVVVPNDSVSVSSKCEKKPVSGEVQDSMKESLQLSSVTRKASSGSLQEGTLSGSQNSAVLVSMESAVGLNGSVLSKCNEKNACSDVPDTVKKAKVPCQESDSGSGDSVVEDCEDQPVKEKSNLNLSCKINSSEDNSSNIVKDCENQPASEKPDLTSSCKTVSIDDSNSKVDVDRIRELRKRKRDIVTNRKLLEDQGNEMDGEDWIEKELENGIHVESANTEKRRRL